MLNACRSLGLTTRHEQGGIDMVALTFVALTLSEVLQQLAAARCVCIALARVAKVFRIAVVLDHWDPWRLQMAVRARVPIDAVEELVLLDLHCTLLLVQNAATESLEWIFVQQRANERATAASRPQWREVDRVAHNVVACRELVVATERRHADEHLEDEHAERPPVGGDVGAMTEDELGREVLGGADDAVATRRLHLHGEAKVDQADVTFDVEHDVLGLEIAVDDVARVNVLERQRDFGCVEAHMRRLEAALARATLGRLDAVEELAAGQELEKEIHRRFVGECAIAREARGGETKTEKRQPWEHLPEIFQMQKRKKKRKKTKTKLHTIAQ